MSVLQGGQGRRRRHGDRGRPTHHGPARSHPVRHGALLALLAAVLAALALLGLMASKAAGPASIAFHSPVSAPPRPKPAPAPVRGDYGLLPAPPAERVAIRLKLPLTSGLLFDVRSGRVLWARNPARALPIASLTKMMTALVVTAHSRPGDEVLITRDALHYSGSGVGLLPKGKRVPLVALLYGLLLPSGNDAAIALAEHVAGTQSHFISLMNQQAHAMGLSCTHFTTVSGIVDNGNHSCAPDLALIAHALLEQPLLAKIVGSRSAVLPFPIKGGKLYLYNNNPLLIVRYPGTDGVKTGFTDAAGECLVATVRRGRSWLGVVLLHSRDAYIQAQTLLNAGFSKLGAA